MMLRRRRSNHLKLHKTLGVFLAAAVMAFVLFQISNGRDPLGVGYASYLLLSVDDETRVKGGTVHDLGRTEPSSSSSCASEIPCMSIDHARTIISNLYDTVPPKRRESEKAVYEILGQGLLKAAAENQQRLVTLQIGGNDGISNDPFYSMFVSSKSIHPNLIHYWMPIVVEPVRQNFEALQRNYARIPNLTCAFPVPWAISYEKTMPDQQDQGTCTFYRFDESKAPECQNKADWIKTQIGTLDKEHIKRGFPRVYDACVVPETVACGTAQDLLSRTLGGSLLDSSLSSSSSSPPDVVIWQMDTEGYESVLLPAMLKETKNLPAMIQYESVVLKAADKRQGTNRLEEIRTLLRESGYMVLAGRGTDDLALRIDATTS